MKLFGLRLWRDWEFDLNLSRLEGHDATLQNHEDRLKKLEDAEQELRARQEYGQW